MLETPRKIPKKIVIFRLLADPHIARDGSINTAVNLKKGL